MKVKIWKRGHLIGTRASLNSNLLDHFASPQITQEDFLNFGIGALQKHYHNTPVSSDCFVRESEKCM